LTTVYSFRLRKQDKELEEILQSMTGKEKAEFIRNALNFYVSHRNILEDIQKNVGLILDKVNGLSSKPVLEHENESSNEEKQVLLDSIQDLLNI